MRGLGSVEAVVAAIQEEARAEIERIEGESAAAVARLREEDAAVPVVVADAETRIAAAHRHARELGAEEDWADRQATLEARERWVARVVNAGLERLRGADAATRHDELVRLAREAVARLPGTRIELLVASRDLPLTADPGWIADLALPAEITVSLRTADAIDGGCIARTADGRFSFDNTYGARARRFEAAWRQALIDRAEHPHPVGSAS